MAQKLNSTFGIFGEPRKTLQAGATSTENTAQVADYAIHAMI